VSGTDSTSPPPDERPSNRTRRYRPKKTPRANFPLITPPVEKQTDAPPAGVLRGADLDVSDPSAGGGRGFSYQWEDATQELHDEIASVSGGAGVSFTFHQSTPVAQWVIDHHLGLIPNVLLLDGSGQQLIAEVQFPSDQTVVVNHSAPYAGTAYLRP
jgi:hypothetical protein